MDYSELTDFQINKLVAEKEFSLKGGGFIGFDETGFKDYCNNPSDAWPIILENGICLETYSINSLWFACYHDNVEIKFSDKNPLRCAMIVYLMMGDDDDDD